ncbi:MAG: 30S ribosomal protein S6 [Candidatus Pacebacteria bacterium]|nr:30S ribosomal protein S6 [Candidatus Paceibacterota bacterium]
MKKEENISKNDIYEIGYLLVSNILEDEILKEVANLKSILEKQKSTFMSGDEPKLINLAYPMSKMIDGEKQIFDKAYFAWIKFRIDVEKLDVFKKELDKYQNILRYLLIKTLEKDTMMSDSKKSVFVQKDKSITQEGKVIEPLKIVEKDSHQENEEVKITEKEKKEKKDLDETIDNLIIK